MPAKGLADSAAGPMTTTGSDLTTADQGDRTRPTTLPSVSVTVAINLPLQPVDGAAAVAATISGRAPSRTTCPGQRSCWSRGPGGRPRVFGFTVTRGKIVEIDLVADPARLQALELTVLEC